MVFHPHQIEQGEPEVDLDVPAQVLNLEVVSSASGEMNLDVVLCNEPIFEGEHLDQDDLNALSEAELERVTTCEQISGLSGELSPSALSWIEEERLSGQAKASELAVFASAILSHVKSYYKCINYCRPRAMLGAYNFKGCCF
jgi:hypothetical protein